MKKDLFSVFIPTYKRIDSLEKTIASVILNWCTYSPIDIVVSDNDVESNNVQKLIKQIKIEFNYERIYYYRNKSNIGIDRNMLKVLNLCDSHYCLMLGDDDLIKNNSFAIINKYISEQEYDFILLNYLLVKQSESIVINDPIAGFAKYWNRMPYGTLIINLDRAKALKEKFIKYIGTSHAYSAIPWEIMCSSITSGNFLFVTDKVVELGIIEKTWQNKRNEILFKEIPQWFNLLPEKLKAKKVKRKYKCILYFQSAKIYLKTCIKQIIR